jgi:hypothetical protein
VIKQKLANVEAPGLTAMPSCRAIVSAIDKHEIVVGMEIPDGALSVSHE